MHMDAAATAWAEVAEATGAAVLLVHHVRKGTSGGAAIAADVDITRGAKSLTDAARAAFLLSVMTSEEAQNLSVAERERWRYVRLDDAKANLAPRAETARWFRLESVSLGNSTAAYPHGDTVAAVAAWKPPSPFRDLSAADCNRALDLIAAGPGAGAAYAAWRRGRSGERWAGRVLMREFGLDEGDAGRVIAAWMRSGVLEEATYHDGQQRKARLGVRVIDARRPTDSNTQPRPTKGTNRECNRATHSNLPAGAAVPNGAANGAANGAPRRVRAAGTPSPCPPAEPGRSWRHSEPRSGARWCARCASGWRGEWRGEWRAARHAERRRPRRRGGDLPAGGSRADAAGAALHRLVAAAAHSRLDVVRNAIEGYGWENQRGERGRLRPPVPDSERIDRMDEALGWIPLIPRDRYVLRRIVGARSLVSPGRPTGICSPGGGWGRCWAPTTRRSSAGTRRGSI